MKDSNPLTLVACVILAGLTVLLYQYAEHRLDDGLKMIWRTPPVPAGDVCDGETWWPGVRRIEDDAQSARAALEQAQ